MAEEQRSKPPSVSGEGGPELKLDQPPIGSGAAPSSAYLFKLISVATKEASLDSPTFRALMDHYRNQAELIEAWLKVIIDKVVQYDHQLLVLMNMAYLVLDHMLPSFINDGLVDPDHAVRALQTASTGLKGLWHTVVESVRSKTRQPLQEFRLIISDDLTAYRSVYADFLDARNKYDLYLARYMSNPRSKTPEALREDAFMLFETRKRYIHLSLDAVVSVVQLQRRIDRAIMEFTLLFWPSGTVNEKDPFGAAWMLACKMQPQFQILTRIQDWSRRFEELVLPMKNMMLAARDQLVKLTILLAEPLQHVRDYDTLLLHGTLWRDHVEPQLEKHGYLFMKTLHAHAPQQPVWVKRWCSVLQGIFGMLVLNPQGTGVLELDKWGVLACNVRYAPEEPRRFCFELSTALHSVVFQAETPSALKSWLKVFSVQKERVLGCGDDQVVEMAKLRFPPLLAEFASTASTTKDVEMFQLAGKQRLLARLCDSDKELVAGFEDLSASIGLFNSPLSTSMTHASILAHRFISPTLVPNAVTANVWGCVNWGTYYFLNRRITDGAPMRTDLPPAFVNNPTFLTFDTLQTPKSTLEEVQGAIQTISSVNGAPRYPPNYTRNLRSLDIRMKLLLETMVGEDEIALFELKCFWLPNSNQELWGKVFVTNKSGYFYTNSMGFLLMGRFDVLQLVSVELQEFEHYLVIQFYDVDGWVQKLRLHMDSVQLIRAKFRVMMQNSVADKPMLVEELVTRMLEIDQEEMHKVLRLSTALLASTATMLPGAATDGDTNEVLVVPADVTPKGNMRVDYSNESKLIWDSTYPVPVKALFHMLMGDLSTLVLEIFLLFQLVTTERTPWHSNDKGQLTRSWISLVQDRNRKRQCKLYSTQTVEQMVDDIYYNIMVEKLRWKMRFGLPAKLRVRLVLHASNLEETRMMVYLSMESEHKSWVDPLAFCLATMVFSMTTRHMNHYLNQSIRRLGTHGQVLRAMKVYGALTKTDTPAQLELPTGDFPVLRLYTRDFIRLGAKMALTLLVRWLFVTVLWVFSWVGQFAASVRMNWVLIAVLCVLGGYNAWLTERTAVLYWSVRLAEHEMAAYHGAEPKYLQRALYLKDVEEMVERRATNPDTPRVYNEFRRTLFVLNFERSGTVEAAGYGDASTRALAQSLHQLFRDIGVQRHELLTRLRMLNRVEEELAAGEWRNWLMSEAGRCDKVRSLVLQPEAVEKMRVNGLEDAVQLAVETLEYCLECERALEYELALGAIM